jgi:DNA (cytosine-5)-methyltransferase 1
MKCSRNDSIGKKKYRVNAVDLFCGVGGLTHGLESVGIDVRLGVDIDPACRFPYTANNKAKFLLKSVEDIHAQELETVFAKNSVRLLAGCAPCQTFSTYNQKADPSDKRWWLLMEFSRIVRELSPELVTMENVPNLLKHRVFQNFVEALVNAGYHVDHHVFDSSDYGVPQHRERLVLLASRLGSIRMLSAAEVGEKAKTVREAICEMPVLKAGEMDEDDPLHQCAALSALNLRRIRASKPGGTWRDWKDGLISLCHKKRSGKTYPSVYGRMCWDELAPTITTQFYGFGNGRFGHPEQDRAISLREGAILQSFPRDYVFKASDAAIGKKPIGRLIGNAVPVKLAEAIGKSLLAHVADYMEEIELEHDGGKHG